MVAYRVMDLSKKNMDQLSFSPLDQDKDNIRSIEWYRFVKFEDYSIYTFLYIIISQSLFICIVDKKPKIFYQKKKSQISCTKKKAKNLYAQKIQWWDI